MTTLAWRVTFSNDSVIAMILLKVGDNDIAMMLLKGREWQWCGDVVKRRGWMEWEINCIWNSIFFTIRLFICHLSTWKNWRGVRPYKMRRLQSSLVLFLIAYFEVVLISLVWLEIGLALTEPINHGSWIVRMSYLISKFKFKLTDISMSYQYQ